MKRIALLFILLAGLPGVAASADVVVVGRGLDSCGKWLASQGDSAGRRQDQQWVLGFLSGSNYRAGRRQSNPLDREAVAAFVERYCTNNPLHPLVFAAAALAQESGGPKAAHEWNR